MVIFYAYIDIFKQSVVCIIVTNSCMGMVMDMVSIIWAIDLVWFSKKVTEMYTIVVAPMGDR